MYDFIVFYTLDFQNIKLHFPQYLSCLNGGRVIVHIYLVLYIIQNLTLHPSNLHAPCLRSATRGDEQERDTIRAGAAWGSVQASQAGSHWPARVTSDTGLVQSAAKRKSKDRLGVTQPGRVECSHSLHLLSGLGWCPSNEAEYVFHQLEMCWSWLGSKISPSLKDKCSFSGLLGFRAWLELAASQFKGKERTSPITIGLSQADNISR